MHGPSVFKIRLIKKRKGFPGAVLAFLIPHINAIQLGTSLSLDGAVLCP
jgi:hypothetical protein